MASNSICRRLVTSRLLQIDALSDIRTLCKLSLSPSWGMHPRQRQQPLQQRRLKSHFGMPKFIKENIAKSRAATKGKDKVQMPRDFQRKMLAEMRFPGTFVPLRPEEQPREWRPWVEYQVCIYKRRAISLLARMSAWMQGTETYRDMLRGRSRLDAESGKLVEYAKDLHQRLGKAVGEGDVKTLEAVCTANLLHTLKTRTIARRREGERMPWQVVEYHRVGVVAHDIMPVMDWLGQQVVVALDSTQRVVRIPGDAVTERRMHENLLLMRQIDTKTFKPSKWKIWGTVPGLALDEYDEMMRGLTAQGQEQIKKQHPELFREKGDNE